ncbi:ATP-binding cassette domain-containing protein [Alicyclobacillus sp.]|uniref:ATP-binding cassette domain-containing protein n=1 Tax=Alicyclobacillus sp. TaxID=61169 RepID=UPI0025B838AD|nr:ATP-binding cassette domain-containing protein [Alicyclobacillus sp.]MCL6516695.1 ATP-binding cassette domain-containing protein [Alicyclobacillus sp.]
MALEASRLTIRSEADRLRLNDVRVRAEDGQLTVLVGPIGSGKSTLLQTLAGLLRPDDGEVSCDGRSLWKGRRPDVTVLRRIGMVFQSPEQQLFARDVAGEFRYSLRPYRLFGENAQRATRAALARVGLTEGILARPPLMLSGGQRRRVAVATTLAPDPDWLLFDEPTAGMDPEAAVRFVRTLSELRNARRSRGQGGILVATHDLTTFLPIADRVWVIHQGRMTADVHPSALYADPRPLSDAGLALPAGVMLQRTLSAFGLDLPTHPTSAEQMAAAIAEGWSRASWTPIPSAEDTEPMRTPPAGSTAQQPAAPPTQEPTQEPETAVDPEANPAPNLLRTLDIRVRWAGYALLTLAVLIQHRGWGLAAATAVAAGLAAAARMSAATVWRLTRAMTLLTLFSSALAGLRFGIPPQGHAVLLRIQTAGLRLAFDPAGATTTFAALYRVVLMVWLSGVLTACTTAMELRRALEQGLHRIPGLRRAAGVLSLSASLVMRFIPVIGEQLDRFSRIARSRAKSPAPVGRIRPRDLPAITVPLLAALFQIAEDLTLAMEARGYRTVRAVSVASGEPRRLRRRDWAALGVAIAAAAALVALR